MIQAKEKIAARNSHAPFLSWCSSSGSFFSRVGSRKTNICKAWEQRFSLSFFSRCNVQRAIVWFIEFHSTPSLSVFLPFLSISWSPLFTPCGFSRRLNFLPINENDLQIFFSLTLMGVKELLVPGWDKFSFSLLAPHGNTFLICASLILISKLNLSTGKFIVGSGKNHKHHTWRSYRSSSEY